MENAVIQHTFLKFDQSKKNRFSIKTSEPQIKQKNPRSSEKKQLWQHWSNVLSRACCATSTKHYDKTVVLWHNTTIRHCDRTRTLTCHIYKASSFSLYKKGQVTPYCSISGKKI